VRWKCSVQTGSGLCNEMQQAYLNAVNAAVNAAVDAAANAVDLGRVQYM